MCQFDATVRKNWWHEIEFTREEFHMKMPSVNQSISQNERPIHSLRLSQRGLPPNENLACVTNTSSLAGKDELQICERLRPEKAGPGRVRCAASVLPGVSFGLKAHSLDGRTDTSALRVLSRDVTLLDFWVLI